MAMIKIALIYMANVCYDRHPTTALHIKKVSLIYLGYG